MNKPRIVGVALVLAAIGAFLWAARENPARTFTLADGSHLYFRAVTCGSNVQMHMGSPIEKVLGQLPGKLGRKYQRNVWTDGHFEQEVLVFWFEFERAPSTNFLVEVKFKELRYFTNFWPTGWLPAQTLPNGRILAACNFHRWPQQDKTLAVRIGTSETKPRAIRLETTKGMELLDDYGEFTELGELTVRNPGYGRRRKN